MVEVIKDPEQFFMIMMPTHRMMNAQTVNCIERAHAVGVPFITRIFPGDALIGRARSIMATWALEHSPTNYTIFIDSDIVFTPEDLTKLWHHLKSGYDLIGGTYTVRYAKQLAHYGTGVNGEIRLDGQVHEVRYLSTGFMGFTRNLLRGIVDKLQLPICHPDDAPFRCYPFFENTAQYFEGSGKAQWIYESEDWDFCRKAAKAGFKPYLDTSIQLGHEGFRTWYVQDMPASNLRPVADTIATKLVVPPSGLVMPQVKAVREAKTSRLDLPLRRK